MRKVNGGNKPVASETVTPLRPSLELDANALGRVVHLRTGPGVAPRIERFPDAGAFAAFAAEAEAAVPAEDINQVVRWVGMALAYQRIDELWLVTDWLDGRLNALLVVPVQTSALDYAIGDWTFLKRPARKFQIYRGPSMTGPHAGDALRRALKALAPRLPGAAVLVASTIAIGGAFADAIADSAGPFQRSFLLLPWGGEQPHCRVVWDGRLDAYLESIGAESRRNLRRYAKKLFDDRSLRCHVKRFARVAEVEDFMRDAGAVSAKTYQAKIPGLGVARGTLEEAQIATAARDGGFLGHILYVNDAPAAFHYGIIRGDCYFVLQMGYDPQWSRYQIGSVLFFEMLKDLEREGPAIRLLDYMSGVTAFKLRTTNEKIPTRTYYMFPRTFSGVSRYATLAATNALSRFIGWALDRLELKARIKSALQRMNRRAAASEPSDRAS